MTKAQRKQQLISDFFEACHQGVGEGVEFIRANIFQEDVLPPSWTRQGDENILQAVSRKYTELDDFSIAVDNFLRRKPNDATPLNITISDRAEAFAKLEPELGQTLYDVFKKAGHEYVIPLVRTQEYSALKTEHDRLNALKVA